MIDKKSNAVQIDINHLLGEIKKERFDIITANSLPTREQAFEQLKRIEKVAKNTRITRRSIAKELGDISRYRMSSICTNGHGGKYPVTALAIMKVSNCYLRKLETLCNELNNAIKDANTNE